MEDTGRVVQQPGDGQSLVAAGNPPTGHAWGRERVLHGVADAFGEPRKAEGMPVASAVGQGAASLVLGFGRLGSPGAGNGGGHQATGDTDLHVGGPPQAANRQYQVRQRRPAGDASVPPLRVVLRQQHRRAFPQHRNPAVDRKQPGTGVMYRRCTVDRFTQYRYFAG